MPLRDDDEFEQRRQQIIDGALVVFLAYILTREIIRLPDSPTGSQEMMVAVTVDTCLRGMDYRFPDADSYSASGDGA